MGTKLQTQKTAKIKKKARKKKKFQI